MREVIVGAAVGLALLILSTVSVLAATGCTRVELSSAVTVDGCSGPVTTDVIVEGHDVSAATGYGTPLDSALSAAVPALLQIDDEATNAETVTTERTAPATTDGGEGGTGPAPAPID